MRGIGTLINVAGVLLGGFAGLIFGKRLGKNVQDTLMTAVGVCVLFLGISGALEQMLIIENNELQSRGTMMMIASISLGAVVGELLNIEGRFERFGEWLKEITKNHGDPLFVDAFVTTSLIICVGAMAVLGAITDGLIGDYSILAAKAVLDMIIVLIMTASKGKGCIFSAIPIFLFQGLITLFARFIEPVMTEQALDNLSLTGSVLIFCVGLNLIWGKKIKVGNLLPAIIFAVIWTFLPL
ncbi:MAG: DUF554 domain-containing protein [Ruminococcus sp.]|jgi:uncharacterized membrane protein YqgA involved in biofilm formation